MTQDSFASLSGSALRGREPACPSQSRSVGTVLVGTVLAVALTPLLMLASACGVPGERADMGECPEGEVCSTATPSGLVFSGAGPSGTLLGGTAIAPTALGGTQAIIIQTRRGEELPAFRAVSSDESVLSVAETVGRRITVHGVAEGSVRLRVLDTNQDDALLDRTSLRASRVDRVQASPVTDLISALAPTRRPAVFVPGEHQVAVHLLNTAGNLVVDQSMTVMATTAPLTLEAWDSFTLTVPSDGTRLDVTLGSGSGFMVPIGAATRIDSLELATWLLDDVDGVFEVRGGSLLCAIGLSGEAWVIGNEAADASADVGGVAMELDPETPTWQCGQVPAGVAVGNTRVTFTIAGATQSFAVRVVASGAASASLVSYQPTNLTHLLRFDLGERARGALLAR